MMKKSVAEWKTRGGVEKNERERKNVIGKIRMKKVTLGNTRKKIIINETICGVEIGVKFFYIGKRVKKEGLW